MAGPVLIGRQALAHRVRAADDDDAGVVQRAHGLRLADHVRLDALERLERGIAGRQQHFERHAQEFVLDGLGVRAGLAQRLLVGFGDIEGGGPGALLRCGGITGPVGLLAVFVEEAGHGFDGA